MTTHPPDERWQLAADLLDQALPDPTLREPLAQWLQALLARASLPTPLHRLLDDLPRLTHAAAGGENPSALRYVSGAWRLLRLAAKLLDDVQDGEAGGGAALTHQGGLSLLWLATLALDHLPPSRALVTQRLHAALLHALAGQHADLRAMHAPPPPSLEAWLHTARAKSGEPLAWASWAGAALVDGAAGARAGYHTYGQHLGILVQVVDDLAEWAAPTPPSAPLWQSLPLCYAYTVLPPAPWARLVARLQAAHHGDVAAWAEAQRQLAAAGAPTYLQALGALHQQQALAALPAAQGDPAAHARLQGIPHQLLALLAGESPPP